MYELWFFFSEV